MHFSAFAAARLVVAAMVLPAVLALPMVEAPEMGSAGPGRLVRRTFHNLPKKTTTPPPGLAPAQVTPPNQIASQQTTPNSDGTTVSKPLAVRPGLQTPPLQATEAHNALGGVLATDTDPRKPKKRVAPINTAGQNTGLQAAPGLNSPTALKKAATFPPVPGSPIVAPSSPIAAPSSPIAAPGSPVKVVAPGPVPPLPAAQDIETPPAPASVPGTLSFNSEAEVASFVREEPTRPRRKQKLRESRR